MKSLQQIIQEGSEELNSWKTLADPTLDEMCDRIEELTRAILVNMKVDDVLVFAAECPELMTYQSVVADTALESLLEAIVDLVHNSLARSTEELAEV